MFAVVSALAVRARPTVTCSAAIRRSPFLYILVGIKFLETRTVRDGSLLVALASFLLVSRHSSPASRRSPRWLAAIPAVLVVLGAALDALARHSPARTVRTQAARAERTGLMIAQGHPDRGAPVRAVPRVGAPL